METTAAAAVKAAGTLTQQFGIQVVVCFVMIIFFGLIVRWVFRFMEKIITGTLADLAAALRALTDSNNASHNNQVLMGERISKDVKDGFDMMKQSNIFQKEEHAKIAFQLLELERNVDEKFNNLEKSLKCNFKN